MKAEIRNPSNGVWVQDPLQPLESSFARPALSGNSLIAKGSKKAVEAINRADVKMFKLRFIPIQYIKHIQYANRYPQVSIC